MQILETEKTYRDEELIKEFLEKKFNRTLRKLPRFYSLDYASCDENNNVTSFCEVKRFSCASTDHERAMVDLNKIANAAKLSSTTNLPCYFVIRWTDCIGMTKIPPEEMNIVFTGRRKKFYRGHKDDEQPYVMIPISKFEILKRY